MKERNYFLKRKHVKTRAGEEVTRITITCSCKWNIKYLSQSCCDNSDQIWRWGGRELSVCPRRPHGRPDWQHLQPVLHQQRRGPAHPGAPPRHHQRDVWYVGLHLGPDQLLQLGQSDQHDVNIKLQQNVSGDPATSPKLWPGLLMFADLQLW